ncbi:anthranilate synthase component I [Actinomyces viscosus C505]|uniref:anthranilate synthase n=1 Tax=Actinomyces viscosus C505 TaxID=562973 RepID=F2UZV2_ACTVI|nr:anthranilate synthase component 1 [Actinomyces viscosus]EGE37706.1 anthranilate synthase component I [Actinomyces viscosus C505]
MSPTVPDSVPDTAPEAAPSAALPTVSPTVLTRSVRYHSDGGALLELLTRSGLLRTTAGLAAQGGSVRPVDCVLLESADITTKASRTTVAVLEASARLTCWGGTVMAEALDAVDGGGPGADGLAALARLEAGLAEHVTDRRPGRLTLTLPTICDDDPSIEERERLTALSTIEPLRLLARAEVDHPHLPLEAGAFAFDYLSTFESMPEVAQGANTCPDYLFYDARIILVVDHPTQEATLVGASVDAADLERRMEALAAAIDGTEDPADSADTAANAAADTAVEAPAPAGGPDSPVLHAVPTVSDADFEAVVEEMRDYIADGDVYQVVPSRGFTIDCPDALAAYHVLRHANPSPYMFYLAAPDFELFGASPESALLYSVRSGRVAIRPIAGTRPRGLHPDGSVDHERDTRLELELRTDAKEVAEHVMLVDLARNDVARVSRPGTRSVQDLLRVDRYSRVMHLVSEVSGELAGDLDALDAFRASMTMGTLTGAPKLRAAELIRQAEGVRRGSYGGSVGYIRGDGELDTCIVIRSGFVTNGRALVQAGAGVVAASSPAAEAAETIHKARAVLEAVAAAQGAALVIDQTGSQTGSRTSSQTSKEA